jgi:hypothetical protein
VEWTTQYYTYRQLGDSDVYQVSYETMDEPDFYLIEVTETDVEQVLGLGLIHYLPNGHPALVLEQVRPQRD